MGWKRPAICGRIIAVRLVDARDECPGAGGAHTICSAALDMMREFATAVNFSRPIATIQ